MRGGDYVTLLGQPVDYWRAISHVMRAHGLTDAEQLADRLKASVSPKRVEVYDEVNQDRLLGTLRRPDMQGPMLCMAAHGRVSARYCAAYDTPPVMESVRHVRFTAGIKRGPNPLDVRGVLTTRDPLNDLLTVFDFHLPGETPEQADARRFY